MMMKFGLPITALLVSFVLEELQIVISEQETKQQHCSSPLFKEKATVSLATGHGDITSPGYGTNSVYPNGQLCVWEFAMTKEDKLVLEIVDLAIINPFFAKSCIQDYLQLPNGHKICGLQNSQTFLICHWHVKCDGNSLNITTQNKLAAMYATKWPPNITFHADHSLGHKGFLIRYKVIPGTSRSNDEVLTPSNSSSSNNNNNNAIIIALACISVLLCVAVVVIIYIRKRTRRQNEDRHQETNEETLYELADDIRIPVKNSHRIEEASSSSFGESQIERKYETISFRHDYDEIAPDNDGPNSRRGMVNNLLYQPVNVELA